MRKHLTRLFSLLLVLLGTFNSTYLEKCEKVPIFYILDDNN